MRRPEDAALTALNLQCAVLLVQRVSPQVHHTGSGGGDPECRAQTTRDCGDYWRFSRTTETLQRYSTTPAQIYTFIHQWTTAEVLLQCPKNGLKICSHSRGRGKTASVSTSFLLLQITSFNNVIQNIIGDVMQNNITLYWYSVKKMVTL